MSDDNVAVVQRIWEAWERRDGAAALMHYDPEVEATSFEVLGPVGTQRTYRGLEGVRRWMRDFSDSFEDFAARAEEFAGVGEGVVVRVRMSGRGRVSGVPSELVFWNAYCLRDGRVVRLEAHREHLDAIGAAQSSSGRE